MRFYVYAIHTDETRNRLYDVFDSRVEAEALEVRMSRGRVPGDNYFVRMFAADDDENAKQRADALRPFPQYQNRENRPL